MNLSPEWARVLPAAGISASHWSQVGRWSASDQEILAFARSGQWTVLTQDLDFPQLLFETSAAGPSVVLLRIRNELCPTAQQKVVAYLAANQPLLHSGALVILDDHKARIRILPLSPPEPSDLP